MRRSSNRISKFSSISESISASYWDANSPLGSVLRKKQSNNVIRRKKLHTKRFNSDILQDGDGCSMNDRIKYQIKKHFTPTDDNADYQNNNFSSM